jgi:F0F1-type ATP synthase assembly protein I
MEPNVNLNQLWQQAASPAHNWQHFAAQLAAMETKKRNERNRVNFLLGVTIVFVAFIAFAYWPMQWQTLLGIVLTECSMLFYLWQYNRLTKVRNDGLVAANAREYLNYLHAERKKQYFIGNKLMTAYFLLLGTGILLYMWEFAKRMPGWYGWLAYALAIGWFALNWFVFRPRVLKKKEAEMNKYIQQLEALQGQWT